MDKRETPMADFEDFLIARNDILDNAAYDLALEMLQLKEQTDSESKFPWSMEIIGAILESTQEILQSHRYAVCWPYREEDVPCCQTASCTKHDCLLKAVPKEDEMHETN